MFITKRRNNSRNLQNIDEDNEIDESITSSTDDSLDIETKNASAWESLITDLSDAIYCHDDDDDDNDDDCKKLSSKSSLGLQLPPAVSRGINKTADTNNNALKIEPSIGNSSQQQRLLVSSSDTDHHHSNYAETDDDDDDESPVNNNNSSSAAVAAGAAASSLQSPNNNNNNEQLLESSTSPLRTWIAQQLNIYPPTITHMGKSLHKSYVLNSTYLALSLSRELGRQFRNQQEQHRQLESANGNGDNNGDDGDEKLEEDENSVRYYCCEDITIENVMVRKKSGSMEGGGGGGLEAVIFASVMDKDGQSSGGSSSNNNDAIPSFNSNSSSSSSNSSSNMLLELTAMQRSTSATSTSSEDTNPNSERRQILALGMIFYELFSQGLVPPPIYNNNHHRTQRRRGGKGSSSLDGGKGRWSFTSSLRISEDNENADDVGGGGGGGGGGREGRGEGHRGKNKDDDDEDIMETEDSQREGFTRKQRRRKCGNDRNNNLLSSPEEKSVSTTLQQAGVPSSICRLISDALSNRDDVDFGKLFQYDKSISSFTDVILDLEQMIDNPRDFLYDTIRLSGRPTIRKKLYCREKEMEWGMELAGRAAPLWYQRCGGKMIEEENGGGGEEEEEENAELLDSTMDSSMSSVKQEVLMISGLSGSGKSSLVNELIAELTSNGWYSLHCKFDQVARPRPLLTIASAFDRFFSSLLNTESASDEKKLGEIRDKILQSLDEESFAMLCHLIPNLKRMVSNDSTEEMQQMKVFNFNESDTMASKCRVQNLFFVLLKEISSASDSTPMLLFLDDLQWADSASLELIFFLIEEMGASITDDTAAHAGRGTNLFIIGTFRTNEVDSSSDLAEYIQQVHSCYNVTVTEMALPELSASDVNLMVSEALCYSQRLTKPLSLIVHHKTTGNPFFVKELLNDLTIENLLVFSFSQNMWEWDEELIESRTVSDGVAEILIKKLLRLPKDQQTGLLMMSCFGSEVSLEVLALVKDSCGNSNLIESLDCSTKAGLLKRTDEKYSFVHDMCEQAAREIGTEYERMAMKKELIMNLVAKTSGCRDDAVLFIIVDLISRVGPDRIHDAATRLLYAELNLIAATKATHATDYACASTCVKCGISFLEQDYWKHSYRLSLDLFKQSALVEWAQGDTEQMMKSIDEVYNNATCFEDKLGTAHVKSGFLRQTGRIQDAFVHGFQVLEQLGESFPSTPEVGVIVQELLGMKQRLAGLSTSDLTDLDVMKNVQKKNAMRFLEEILIMCYQNQSKYFPLIAIRMVKITLQYGLSKYSCAGFAMTALSFVTVFNDFSLGYSLSKMSVTLAGSDQRLLPTIYCAAFGMVNIWKEPVQAIVPHLKDAYSISVKSGMVDNACAAAMFYCYRAFFTGSMLTPLGKEVALFMRMSERRNRKVMSLSMLTVSNAISCLGDISSEFRSPEDFITDEHLAEAVRSNEFTICESMLAIKFMCSFIFRRFDEVKTCARQYLELFERQGDAAAQFINIYRIFYGCMISLHFYRESQDQFWMDRATHAVKKMETWMAASVWNFENKLFLLQAESHYAVGEMDRAAEKYTLAIESSRKHRFVHEEALACELAAAFHEKLGNVDLVEKLTGKAVECYQKWGAEKKVNSLQQTL